MKRKITILAGLTLSFSIALTQPSGLSVPLDSTLHVVTDMIHSSSGNFIISGKNFGQGVVCITSITSDGEIVWSRHLVGDMEWYSNIFEKSNGNILVPMSSYYAKLIELNSNGDSVDCLYITSINQSLFGSVIEISDSLIIATELIRNDDPFFPAIDSSFFVKIDGDLNVIEKIPSQYSYIMNLMKISNDEFFALSASYYYDETFVLKYNLDGQIINQTTCTDSLNVTSPYRMYNLTNDNIFAIGSQEEAKTMKAHLSKFYQSGEIEYCKDYLNYYFISVTINESTESLFALGNQYDSCTIYNLDYSGNLISTFTLNDSIEGNNIIYDEGNFYIAGSYYPPLPVGSRFIKIPGDSVFSTKENQEMRKINVYPNPAKDNVLIEVSSLKTKTSSKIRIVDVLGHDVERLPITSEKTVWDCKEVKNGIYFYFLEIAEKGYSGKIFINK